MSAETLRRAAKAARDEWAGETTGPFKNAAQVHLAVADWLEATALTWFHLEQSGAHLVRINALAVARTYLGESVN